MRKTAFIIFVAVLPLVNAQPINEPLQFFPNPMPEVPIPIWENGRIFSAQFAKPFYGIGDNLYTAKLSFFSRKLYFGRLGGRFEHISNKYFGLEKIAPIGITRELRVPYIGIGVNGWLSPTLFYGHYFVSDFHEFVGNDPVFADRSWFLSVGLDGGARIRIKNGHINLWLENIVKPCLSVSNGENSSQRRLNFTADYRLGRFLWLWAGGKYQAGIGFVPQVGAKFSYAGANFLAGVRNYSAWVELVLPFYKSGFHFGYSMGYHFATPEVASSGLVSHEVSLIYAERVKPPPPPPPKPNLFVMIDSIADVVPLDTVKMRMMVANNGEAPIDSPILVSLVRVAYGDTKVVRVDTLPPLDVGDTIGYSISFLPKVPGSYSVFLTVDDDGSRFPGVNGKILETDETDNRLAHSITVYEKVRAEVKPKLPFISIPTLTYIRQEEPLEPMVFFEPNSDSIPPRFMRALSVIAERMIDNPEVLLEVRGYVDTLSDTLGEELARRRGEKVAKTLVRLGAPKSSVILVPTSEYDYMRPRIKIVSPYVPKRDKEMICEENRRVEITAKLIGVNVLAYQFEIGLDETDLPDSAKAVFDTLADKIAGLLCSNANAVILIEGIPPKGTDPVLTLEKLDMLRNYLLPKMQMFCPLERIPIALGAGERESDKALVKVWLTAEEIVFKSIKEAIVAKDFDIPAEYAQNVILVDITADTLIDSHMVCVIAGGGEETTVVLSEGAGPPPKKIPWNWRDKEGNLIDPRKSYQISVHLKDKYGHSYDFLSEPILILVENWEHRTESSVMVRFTFDEAISESKYLESRLEDLAKVIISKANIPGNKIIVRVVGHTDIIGTPARNLQLSYERANHELYLFKELMRFTLGLKTQKEFQKWLNDHNIKFVVEGKRDLEPYKILRFKGGKVEEVLIGDDRLPEGRSINRRVTISIEEILQRK